MSSGGGHGMLGSVILDLRYALRSLSRRPGYALLTIGVLTLAIAGNTTVFSALNGFLLRRCRIRTMTAS
jgi:putative ABC transport system permease protein